MANDSVFAPRYSTSWALVIGIDKYKFVSPLGYACSDADAVASHLIDALGFDRNNVSTLSNEGATRQAIMSAFLALVNATSADDRVVVFFAGHGLTRPARRGEVGYLVPHDGDPSDLATLVRWDDLTRNAELIPAKHVLFIMDACYGGLALSRTVPRGSQRFLKDMLARYSRQVLTAGKADETVADSGGPRPGHSVFTGHLLDALEGNARTSEGIITANGVMAYVYDRVAKDPFSRQSPHYGFLDGDGDFVFDAPQLESILKDELRDTDVLVEPLEEPRAVPTAENRLNFAATVKEYLSEARFRIRLDDLANIELRAFHQFINQENFPLQTSAQTPEDVAERLRSYERAVDRLTCLASLVARWGGDEHRATLSGTAARLVENNDPASGSVLWIGLRWHPADVFLAAAGVAAISSGAYENLAAVLLANVTERRTGQGEPHLLTTVVDGVWEAVQQNAYKMLPGHERNFTPRSEYLFKVLQPLLEDVLYLGRTYESLFDRYEVLAALVYVDLRNQEKPGLGYVWGPPGRFAWKAKRGVGSDPLTEVLAEAARSKEDWVVLRAGLFGGSYDRFEKVATEFRNFILRLPYY